MPALSAPQHMRKIIGHIIALTKSIWLVQPLSEHGYMAQFIVGKKQSFAFSGGFGISWWYTKSSFKSVESIASMLVESRDEFADCDLDSVEDVVRNTLTEICVDDRIFAADNVCFAKRQTLFECRSAATTAEFGSLILHEIIKNLNNQLTNRCTVYVAPRISGPSFDIATAGISVISRTDANAWEGILRKRYQTNGWNPATGNYAHDKSTVFSMLAYNYVFVCEEHGTQKGTTFASGLKLRRFFSVIFAVVSARSVAALIKSSAVPYRMCLQFPGPGGQDALITTSEIGLLIPYYVNDQVLTSDNVSEIQAWFDAVDKTSRESASRIEKGAHFINKAMNSDDIESYVNYFVALDALFGERGSVEASILAGVKSLGLGQSMEEKTPWLFELRNELVHGGSRYIKEWPKHHRYYRHFDSKPDQDIEKLAFAALLKAPNVFAGTQAPPLPPLG